MDADVVKQVAHDPEADMTATRTTLPRWCVAPPPSCPACLRSAWPVSSRPASLFLLLQTAVAGLLLMFMLVAHADLLLVPLRRF